MILYIVLECLECHEPATKLTGFTSREVAEEYIQLSGTNEWSVQECEIDDLSIRRAIGDDKSNNN